MTRRKKSRTPGTLGVKSQPKRMRARKEVSKSKAPAKGRPAGSRHNLKSTGPISTRRTSATDPRIGSKRKVSLYANESLSKLPPEQELAKLENDERLQALLTQLDEGAMLVPRDRLYVDQKLKRYRELVEELGIENEVDELDANEEDELEPWQKFDNPKDWV